MQNCVLFINTPLSPSFVSHGGTLNQVDISIRSSDLSSHVSPLIQSTHQQTTVSLFRLEVLSTSLNQDTPFLSSGLFSRFNLISSTFSNLSTSLLANSKDGVWSDDVTDSGVIASSNFDRCDACCTGALYSSNRFRTLSTLNCSFSHFTLTNEVQQTLTETASFIGDVFASLTRNGEGGAIQFKPSDASAVLTVTNCAFTTCNSTSSFKGGAIHASNGKVVVAGTTFTECTGHSGGAIATTAAQLTVSDSAFYSCKAICLSWIEARGDRNFHAEAWTEENERVNGGGGAMWIELLSSYYLISACLFESCLAPSFGGGVVLWPYGCAAPTFFRMVNCMFLGTTVSTIKIERSGGQNVMIACNKFTANDYDGYLYFQSEFNNQDGILTKRLDSLFTDTTDTEAKNVQLGTSSYVYGATVESMDADVYVATSGSDVFNCGDQSNLCKTVTYAGNKVKANCKVIVAAGTYSSENGEETCILVNAKTVRIEGAGSSSTSVSFIKPTFFQTSNMKMTTGTISVSAISLTLNADSTDTWHLIEVDGSGSATLTDCILKGTRSAQNGRLVSIIGGSLAATGCEFNDIQSTLSTGAAIHADLASSSSLIILSSSFTNCKLGSESENVGAALFINLRDNAKYYYMRELTFAGGEANRAADIFISTPTLDKESEYLTKYKFEVSWQNNAADNLRIRCFSRDPSFKPQELGIPFYIAGQTELFVNSSKSDSEDCGWQDAPCQSVTYAGSQISLSGMTVFVMVSAYLKGTTDIAGSTIQPEHESDQATLQITAVSNLTITDTTTATISRIDFAFQTPLSSSTPLLSTSTGSFILQSCSFKSSGSVVAAQTLISVSATGSITTDGLRVADISFSSPAISVASSSISVGDVTFSSCSFTGTLPASLVSISPSSPSTLLSVGKVSFTSFSTTSSPSSSSELTLALISGPQTSTFAASTATLITSAAGSLTSNTAISFSGSSSSSAPLLKLSLGSTLSATVSNTKVVFPSSTNAGSTAALADTTSSSLSFSASTIDTSNLSGFFTSSIFAVPANTLSISFSSLSSFLSGSSKVMSVPLARVTGGSLSLSKVKLDTTILSSSFTSSVVVQSAGKVDISDSEFWSIASSASGSVISATLRTGASLSLSAVTFTSCTSTKDGGPLHVTVNGGTFSTSGTITFDQCSAAGNGNCLYLSNSNLVTLLEVGILNSFKPSLPNDNALFSSTQKERFFGYQSDTSLGSLLYYWYPHTTSATSTHIHSSGEDHSLCGLVSLPCQSISTALSHPNAQNTFSVDSPLTLSETVTVTQTATLTSSSSTAITVSSTGFISVASNELTLSNLMFTGPGSATSQSFVSVTSTGSLTVSSCSFTSFSSSTNGGALNVALTAGSLSITGTTFKKCSSSLNGGAIFVDLTSLSSPGSYSLSLVTFGTAAGEVNSCGGNGKGSDLFISVASGKTSLISSASLTGSYFTTPSGGSSSTFTTSEMSKYEFSEVDGSSGSILYLLHPYTGGQLFVDSESAADNDLCGNKYLACQTLPLGHSSSKDSSDGPKASVFLSTNVALSEAFSSEKTVLWTSSESSDKTISFASNDSILISSDHLSLSHLVLTVSADQYSKSFFTVSGGLLSVSDCEFKSIASSASGSAISATLGTGASLSLTSVAFTSCTSTADGGALHVTVNGGTFTTSGTITFDKCSATGNGNCLYLSNSNLVTLLEVGILNSFKPSLPNDNALFSSTQKERFFGYQSDTSLGSLLYYWYPHTTSATSTHIHSSGEDHSLCGLVSLPCQSISTALTHPNSKNTFSVDSPLTLSETVTVTQTATLTASSSTAITVSSTGSISVTSNTLTLSNLMFTGPGSATSQSFVTVSSTGSLSVSSCSFTSFSSSTNGGALNIALTTGSLSITGTTFKKCSSSLNGGAIFVDLTSLSSPGSYSLSSVAFGTADGDLNSCWGSGSDLFISVASGQTSLISFASLTGSYFTTPSGGSSSTFTSSEMSKYEFLEESGSSGSILYLLHPYTGGQLFVNSESAADNALCGHKYLACQTLPLGHSSSKDSSDGTEASVFLSTSVTLSDAFSSMQTVKWTSDPSSRKIITIAADVSIEISSGHLSLSHLILTVSAAPYSKSFFTVNGGSLSVSSCLFMSIESSASGSAISATLGSGTSLSLVSVIFTSCTSTANGGALQVTVSGGTFSTSGTIIFEGCSATGDGQSLYLSNSDLVSLLKVGTLDSIKPSLPENNALFSSTEKERFFGCQSDTSKGSLLHYWYPRTSNVFRVNSEGDEHPLCGIASLPCASLEYAHDSLAQSESELVLTSDIQLASQLDAKFEAETIKCEESLKKTLTIQSTGSVTVGSSAQKNMDYALTFSTVSFLFDTAARSSPFLHVSGGILVFAACIFGTSTATTTLPNNVVLVDRGTLTMTTSTIQNMSSSYPLLSLTGGQTTLTTLDTKSIALTQTTLISLSGADLAIASSTFNTITNTLGNGSILSATVPSGDTVIIEDGSATSCSTTGNGGAIFVRLAGNGRFEMKGTSGMSFSNCKSNSVPESAQGTTGNGNCVFLGLDDGAVNFSFGKVRFPSAASTENPAPFLFVESDDLETSITTTRFSFLLPFTFNETDYVKYHGMVTSEFTTHQSLVPYLNKLTEAYLSTAGSDAGKCGSDVTPCESLAKALTWLIVDTTDTESLPHYQVLLMNNGIHNTTIDMEEYILSVTTIDTLATQDLTTTGSSFILGDKATGDTTLALRNMHLKWTGAAGTFLDQSKGIVMLSACSLVIDDATTLFSSSALIVKGGTLTLSELTLNCNTLSTSPLLEMSGGKADISALLISNAQLASSLFTGSGDLTIKSSSFSSLSSSTSSSILFTLSTSSHKLHIGSAGTPVEFTSCSSSTDGGALNVALTAGSLSIESTSFKKCWSSLNGGAIFVDLTSLSSPGSYSLSSVTFGTAAADLNSCGQGGSDLFISVASYRTSLISSSSLRGSYFEAPFDGASTFASSEMSKYEFSEIDGSSGSILYLLHPYTGGQLFVDSESAADNALCGHSYLACKTLPLGHSSSKDSSDGPKASVFLSANVALSAVFSSSKTVIWTTDQSSKKTITLTTDDTITISSKLLSLAHLILTVSAGTFSKSFFTVNGGSLSVSDCEFKSIASSASGSAISATLGTETSLSLSAVAFTSCTSTADGGALSITLTTGSLSLQSTSFKKCSSSLNGGAIWMDLLGMSSPSQYSLIDTVFGTGADANHAARSGHHVYVIAKDLSEVIVASRWAGSFDTAEDEDLWGMDSESNEMSLLPILKSHVIAVGENGSDDADGTFASPFRTFHRCLESTKGQAGPFTVEIVKKATIGRSCSLASQPSTTVHVRGSGSSGDLLCTVSDESSESGTSISSGPTAMVLLSLQTLTFSQIVFSSFSAQKSVRFVFSLMSSSRLVLTSCSISSSAPLSVSLVSASSSSSFSAVALATSALSFVGKASLVVCGDRSRISIASSSFSSTSFDAGAFVWGSTRGDVSVEDTAFVGCGGREFGSLIRVKMAGCTASIKKCRFVSCSTVLSLSERGKRRIVGGGCVLVEMARQTPVPRSLPPSCADLSLSSFTSCSLINTDLPHSLSSSSQFVGGSAFAIVSHDNSGLVKLPKVALSNCTCEHFAGDGVFDGGVVVGEGQHVRTDRRGCVVDKCRLGSIVLH